MGGTSTDVCLIRDGKAEMAFGRSVAGFPVRLPSIDIHTVGAGGGSVAHIGRDGLMRVGPMSTGAVPGPACYGRGGQQATVSDANIVLGRLPEELIGGGMRLDKGLAEAAIAPLAQTLGLGLRETALGIVRIVNANMMRAIRVVSIERGHDPRGFTLMPFGGAGALHAVEIAREIGIRSILVPPAPGILCAEGVGIVAAALARLQGAARKWLAREGGAGADGGQEIAVDMRYVGQNFELPIPVDEGVGLPPADTLRRAFLEAHQKKYGHHDPAAAIEIVNVRLSVRQSRTRTAREAPRAAGTRGMEAGSVRPVWFEADRATDTRFVDRSALAPGAKLEGPMVITQFDATTLVPPGSLLTMEASGSLLIEVDP
jgi:N-methylhydantoinase A